MTNEQYDSFLNEATHTVNTQWSIAGGRPLSTEELYALNDVLTAFFAGKDHNEPSVTRDATIQEYVNLKAESVLYDAHNSTSFEEEVEGLVRQLAEQHDEGTLQDMIAHLKEQDDE